MIGACKLPGPAALTFKSDVHVARIRIPTTMTGSTAPLAFVVACALPRLNPCFRANTPVATPRIKKVQLKYW